MNDLDLAGYGAPYDDDPADYEYLDFIQRGGQE